MVHYVRGLERPVQDAWESASVVVLEGPRAAGKTTLVKQLRQTRHYVDLSVSDDYDHAAASPRGWVETLAPGTVIDEAQRISGLDAEVKRIVDRPTAAPGHFLLTGSVRMRRTDLGSTDPLVGRARRLQLLPFAQCEIEGSPRDVVSELMNGDPATWATRPTDQSEAIERVTRGGFPFLQNVRESSQRRNLIEDYVRGVFDPTVHRAGRGRSTNASAVQVDRRSFRRRTKHQ